MNITAEFLLSSFATICVGIIAYFLKRAHTELDDLKEDVATLKEDKATHQIKLDNMKDAYEFKLTSLERTFRSEVDNVASSNKKDLQHVEQMITSHFSNFTEKFNETVKRLENSIDKLSK